MVLKAACMGPLPRRRTNLYWPCKAALTCSLLAHYGIVDWDTENGAQVELSLKPPNSNFPHS